MSNKLSDFVRVNRHFLRSIRLDSDVGKSDAIEGYILQTSAKNVLDTMSKHISNTQQRAFTWTGPYGGGKSSLALVLASLAGGDSTSRKVAKSILSDSTEDSGLAKYFGTRKPWLVLPVVGKRAPIASEITNVLNEKLNIGDSSFNSEKIIDELVKISEDNNDFGGVLLIVDELGKFLEHAAQTGQDIGFYQDLAEKASRSKGKFVVIGILHQAFEQYAIRLGQATQIEWAKVQGRYVDIPLVAGSDEVVSLIGRALNVTYNHNEVSNEIASTVSSVISKRRPSAASNLTQLLAACWPLHPVTASMLGPTSKKRFGQNERSVFSFLASAEPLGFTEIINGLEASSISLYWPSQFWDYLKANFEPAILSSPDGHRWASCAEAIERTEAKFSQLHVDLVKTVGLIEILRNGSGLAAEDSLLVCSINPTLVSNVSILDALNELCSASILIYRKHLDAYGITAGSDFDIEHAVRSAKLKNEVADISKLSGLVELGHITARRHYWEYGAMRWFSRAIVNVKNAQGHTESLNFKDSECGQFLLLIGWNQSKENSEENRLKTLKKLAKSAPEKRLLIGAPKNADRIEEYVEELVALEYVRLNSQQLDGDSIARREIAARIQSIRALLSDELKDAFHSATWVYRDGQKAQVYKSHGDLSYLASLIANEIYYESPVVHSELVNRNDLSTSAAKAQRDLLHALLTRNHLENLGYSSFSADAGLYQTVIKALGLHRKSKDEFWKLSEPDNSELAFSMQPAWLAAKQFIFNASNEIVTLDKLYSVWSSAPYGIKKGLLPIFALVFFLSNRSQLALYVEGVFTPEINEANVDEWLQDPKRIGWRFVKIETNEKELLTLLSEALTAKLGYKVSEDAFDTARGLVSIYYNLPNWTQKTNTVSKLAQDIRKLLKNASDPHKVIFNDIPSILKTDVPSEIARQIAEITSELANAFEVRLRSVEERLLLALDHQGDFKTLNLRGQTVAGIGAEFKLESFATRLAHYTGALEDIEGLIMLALGVTSNAWVDHSIDEAEAILVQNAITFRRLETIAGIRGKKPTRRSIGVVFGAEKTVSGAIDVSESDSLEIQTLANEILAKLVSSSKKQEITLAAIAEVGAKLLEQLNRQEGKS